MPNVVIVNAARSPIGRAHKGSLKGIRPDDLAAQIVDAVLEPLPEALRWEIEDLIVGCAQPAGEAGYNLGRIIALRLGMNSLPGTTVNRYCASSLQAARMGFHAIRAGEGTCYVAAGVETVSRYGKGKADGMPDTRNPLLDDADGGSGSGAAYRSMGLTAEAVASLCNVSRAAQDEFALESQRRAEAARLRGFWEKDITPVRAEDGQIISSDDSPRPASSRGGLADLAPVFLENGTVTAGNSCPLNDGASAVVLMSEDRARELEIQPLARIVSTGVTGLDPEIMGLGPVESSRIALKRARMSMSDVDLIELNEAFAAQAIPSAEQLGISHDRLNVNGGAIALGHPFGSTGARMLTTLIHGLQERDKTTGLATLCVGGGQGMAMVIERTS